MGDMPIRAAVMVAPHQPVEIREIEDPEIEPGSILLQTVASEVCGTDVHLSHGRLSGVPYPIIPGHVSVGRILETGGEVRDFAGRTLEPGVLVTFYDVHETCHACWFCLVAGQPNRCASRRVYGISYSADEGPLAGFAAVQRSGMRIGDTVLVLGSGPVGLSTVAMAAIGGAALVINIGDPRDRLDLARRLGADVVLSVSGDAPAERAARVRELTGGRGVDVVIEVAGQPSAVAEGLDLLRDGGTCVIAGHYTDTGTTPLNPHLDVNRKHADIRGQWCVRWPATGPDCPCPTSSAVATRSNRRTARWPM
ncbi:MAG: zinc-binding dehydrogenase [Gemmatimonadota bacterium]